MFEKQIKEKVEEIKENKKPVIKRYLIQAGIVLVIGIFSYKTGFHEGFKTGLLINKE